MEKKVIYELKSLYRDSLRIMGYQFGEGKPTICIVGSMRGNEVQQLYLCARLIQKFTEYEEKGYIDPQYSILVIPSINHYGMNINHRFWPQDDTDINRMFPGYNEGETTQRIAEGVFHAIKDFAYGIQLTSFYIPGEFASHIRIMKTGLEDIETAKLFGLPYIVVRNPRPYDTTTLNYNWQIWEAKAYSLYTKETDVIDEKSVNEGMNSILRFMYHQGILTKSMPGGYMTEIIYEEQMISLKCQKAGILKRFVDVEEHVKKGTLLAQILDSYDASVIEEIVAPMSGIIFFLHVKPLVYGRTAVIKMKVE